MDPNTTVLEKVELAWAIRNDVHGEDAIGVLQSFDGNLKGIIICDGVSKANGRIASSTTVHVFQNAFMYAISHDGDPSQLEETLDELIYSAPQNIQKELEIELNDPKAPAATTALVGLTDGNYLYAYYIGDGAILHYSGDLLSYATYLVNYNRGGKLEGYVSGQGVSALPTFLSVRQVFSDGSYLVLATDGVDLLNPTNYTTFWNYLNKHVQKSMSLQEVLDNFIQEIPKIDDASIGVIYVPGASFLQ